MTSPPRCCSHYVRDEWRLEINAAAFGKKMVIFPRAVLRRTATYQVEIIEQFMDNVSKLPVKRLVRTRVTMPSSTPTTDGQSMANVRARQTRLLFV